MASSPPSSPTPVASFGAPHRHYSQTDSTNTRARELAAAGAPHGTVVTAAEQTAGRGQHQPGPDVGHPDACVPGGLCRVLPLQAHVGEERRAHRRLLVDLGGTGVAVVPDSRGRHERARTAVFGERARDGADGVDAARHDLTLVVLGPPLVTDPDA